MMGFIGHIGLWCVLFNRIHATAWPRPTRKFSEKAIVIAVLFPFFWIFAALILQRDISFDVAFLESLTRFYFYACVLLGIFFALQWLWRRIGTPYPDAVVEKNIEWLNLDSELDQPLLHGKFAIALGNLPFNEALKLTRQRMTLALDVPKELDGLKICQLSDLHFTGQVDLAYFQRVVEEANHFQPDLTIITGDIVDEPECLDWINESLGNLQARLGVYYVLGNHDRRIKDERMLRKRIHDAGLIQASGTWHQTEFQGATIRITGNELPWYRDADELESTDDGEDPDLKILLSHSPDQLKWALDRDFDLMFAGHTHGGQIALPFFGPLVAPSKYGVLYAGGTYQIGKILMHVSRGISGDETVRFCSPPELGLFTIRQKT